jgi:hypothetical protein
MSRWISFEGQLPIAAHVPVSQKITGVLFPVAGSLSDFTVATYLSAHI